MVGQVVMCAMKEGRKEKEVKTGERRVRCQAMASLWPVRLPSGELLCQLCPCTDPHSLWMGIRHFRVFFPAKCASTQGCCLLLSLLLIV